MLCWSPAFGQSPLSTADWQVPQSVKPLAKSLTKYSCGPTGTADACGSAAPGSHGAAAPGEVSTGGVGTDGAPGAPGSLDGATGVVPGIPVAPVARSGGVAGAGAGVARVDVVGSDDPTGGAVVGGPVVGGAACDVIEPVRGDVATGGAVVGGPVVGGAACGKSGVVIDEPASHGFGRRAPDGAGNPGGGVQVSDGSFRVGVPAVAGAELCAGACVGACAGACAGVCVDEGADPADVLLVVALEVVVPSDVGGVGAVRSVAAWPVPDGEVGVVAGGLARTVSITGGGQGSADGNGSVAALPALLALLALPPSLPPPPSLPSPLPSPPPLLPPLLPSLRPSSSCPSPSPPSSSSSSLSGAAADAPPADTP
jgi:hypothetical protein